MRRRRGTDLEVRRLWCMLECFLQVRAGWSDPAAFAGEQTQREARQRAGGQRLGQLSEGVSAIEVLG